VFGIFYPGHPYPAQAVWLTDAPPVVVGDPASETVIGTVLLFAALNGTYVTAENIGGTFVTSVDLTGTVDD
jgi:hypothetical protein